MTNITDRLSGYESSVAVKAPVKVATTGNITLSGAQTIDGVAVTSPDRVLVWAQSNAIENGIWVVSSGDWFRSSDFNGSRDAVEGTEVPVVEGALYTGARFSVSTENPVIGSSAMAFLLDQNSVIEYPGRSYPTLAAALSDLASIPDGSWVLAAGAPYINDDGTLVDQTTVSLSVTVGASGEYSTLNEALAAVTKQVRGYRRGGAVATVTLLTGFVLSEQVLVESLDLGFVRIVSQDWPVASAAASEWWVGGEDVATGDYRVVKSTGIMYQATSDLSPSTVDPATDTGNWTQVGTPATVTRSAITQEPDWTDWRAGVKPLFAAFGPGAVLPIIGCPFVFDTSSDGEGVVGFFLGKGASGRIERKSGFIGPAWRNVYLDHGVIYARDCNVSGGGVTSGPSFSAGFRISNVSSANLRGSVAVGCGIGAYINASNVIANDLDASGSVIVAGEPQSGFGLLLQKGAEFTAAGTVDVSGAGRTGLVCTSSTSTIDVLDASNSSGSGVVVFENGVVCVNERLDVSTAADRGVNAYSGGSVVSPVANDASGCTGRAVSLSSGGRSVLQNLDATSCGTSPAVQLFNGAYGDFVGGSIVDLSVSSGSIANIVDATDGVGGDVSINTPLNKITSSGTVIGDGFDATVQEIGDASTSVASDTIQTVRYTVNLTTNRSITLPDPATPRVLWIERPFSAGSNSTSFPRTVNIVYGGTIGTLMVGFACRAHTNASGTGWTLTFHRVDDRTRVKSSADNGDASLVIAQGSASVQYWNTPLTATRTATLPAPTEGVEYTVTRGADATGAFNLDVLYSATTIGSLTGAGQSLRCIPNSTATGWVVFP